MSSFIVLCDFLQQNKMKQMQSLISQIINQSLGSFRVKNEIIYHRWEKQNEMFFNIESKGRMSLPLKVSANATYEKYEALKNVKL